jgi:hypothetical protein
MPSSYEPEWDVERDAEPFRVLIVSTMRAPEINEMFETNELWVRDYVPGTDPPEGALDASMSMRDTSPSRKT